VRRHTGAPTSRLAGQSEGTRGDVPVAKDSQRQSLDAVCRLLTHVLGWELRLEVAGSLQRSQVCRTQDEVLDAYDSAHTAILDTFHGRGLLLFGAMGSPMRTRKRV